VTVALVPASLRARFSGWLNDRPDDSVLRWLFRVMLAVTAAVLVVDFVDLNAHVPEQATASPASAPSATPDDGTDLTKTVTSPSRRDGDERRAPLRRPDAQLSAAMTFDLVGDGRLLATGTINPGTANAFAAEIAKRGGYVKTVVLHSPGGSVTDALDMGRLIRKKGFATEVEDDRYCASSCPLVCAGGVERRAGSKAAIGVHQVTAVARDGTTHPPDGAERVQRISADCQRYLRDMGVDSMVWIHAMETPANELFYFKPDELVILKLATPRAGAPATATAPADAKPKG
jgi:hypothetical protein